MKKKHHIKKVEHITVLHKKKNNHNYYFMYSRPSSPLGLMYFYDARPSLFESNSRKQLSSDILLLLPHLPRLPTSVPVVTSAHAPSFFSQHLAVTRDYNSECLRRYSWTPDTVDHGHNVASSPVHSG